MVSLAAYGRLVGDNVNFRRLWIAQIVSEIGDWFYALAVYALLLELTGRAESVGLAVVLQVLPQTFIGPTAGVVNDRISRKRVMIGADLARAAVVLGMLLVRGADWAWLAFPLLLLETVMAGFFEPARSSVIPNIVPADEVLTANTLSSITWSFNLAIGSTVGGLVAYAFGRDAVFLLNAVSFGVSAWFITRMRFDEPHLSGAAPFHARELIDFRPMLDGLRYMRMDKRLFATLFCKFGLGFMGANNVILPILGGKTFALAPGQRAEMLGMSLLMGARGIGALVGPLISGAWARGAETRLRLGILLGYLGVCVGYATVGSIESAPLTALAVVLAHASGSTIWVFSTTLLQRYSEDRFRGRVFAAELALIMFTIAVSSYACGFLLDAGVAVRTFAFYMGLSMLLPAAGWLVAQRFWTPRQ